MSDRLPAAPDRLPATTAPLSGDLARLIFIQEWMVDVGWNGPAALTFHGTLIPWHPVGGQPDWFAPRQALREATFRSWCEITDHFEGAGAEWLDEPVYKIALSFPHLIVGPERNLLSAVGWWRVKGVGW
jgi:hypothetical protein